MYSKVGRLLAKPGFQSISTDQYGTNTRLSLYASEFLLNSLALFCNIQGVEGDFPEASGDKGGVSLVGRSSVNIQEYTVSERDAIFGPRVHLMTWGNAGRFEIRTICWRSSETKAALSLCHRELQVEDTKERLMIPGI